LEKVWSEFPSHSVTSTVLLDDSARKAQKQPWNHIVIQEYTAALRLHDKALSDASLPPPMDTSPKRRKSKRHNGDLVSAVAPPAGPSLDPDAGYDETLLAIVGVLEEMKWQTNVSSWLRSGGLREGGANDEDQTWFLESSVARNWVKKGQDALEVHGIESSPILLN
jgi:hypothetical protein